MTQTLGAVAPPQATAPRVRPAPSAHRYRVILVIIGTAVLITIAVTKREALAMSAVQLRHLRWLWVPIALWLEWVSISAFARMQNRLLRAGDASMGASPMLATVYAANALSTSLPLGGPELGAAFTFRRFTKQGVDAPLAGWAVMVGGVMSPLAGIFVFMAGALISGNHLLALLGVLAGLVGIVAVVVLHTGCRHSRTRNVVEPAAAWVLRRGRRLLRRQAGDPPQEVRAWMERLASLRPAPAVWLRAGASSMVNWIADAGVFAVSIYAVGGSVPWRPLLLVYGSGVVIRSLGITPGGLGLVEGTLCLGLVGAGVHANVALASVLFYRLVSFWFVAAAGWIVLLALRLDSRRNPLRIPTPQGDRRHAFAPGGTEQ